MEASVYQGSPSHHAIELRAVTAQVGSKLGPESQVELSLTGQAWYVSSEALLALS